MITGTYAQLVQIRTGLLTLQTYQTDATLVLRTYMVHVPEIDVDALSQPDFDALIALGWRQHLAEGGMYYSLAPIREDRLNPPVIPPEE